MGFLKPHTVPPPTVPTAPAAPPPPPTLNSPSYSVPAGENNPIGLKGGTSSTIGASPQGMAALPADQLARPQLNSPIGQGSGKASAHGSGDTSGSESATATNAQGLTGSSGIPPGLTILTPDPQSLKEPTSITIKSLLGGE